MGEATEGPSPWPPRSGSPGQTFRPQQPSRRLTDVLDAAAGNLWGFPQWDADDPEGKDVRITSVGQLSVIFFAHRAIRRLSVLDIVWLG